MILPPSIYNDDENDNDDGEDDDDGSDDDGSDDRDNVSQYIIYSRPSSSLSSSSSSLSVKKVHTYIHTLAPHLSRMAF
jgi:hypothetical protein